MRNKTLLRVVPVLCSLIVLAATPSAYAAKQIVLSVNDCPSGQDYQWNANNNTLSCVATNSVSIPGSCTITANPTSQPGAGLAAGTQVQLTALCTTGNTPITYTWSDDGTAPSVRTVAPSATTTYSVTPSNSSGPAPLLSTTVYIGSSGTAPANCTIGQSPNTAVSPVNAGTPVTLTASCSGGSPVTSCAWSGNVPASSACSVSVTAPSANEAYSVTASNSYGSAPSVSTTIQVNTVSSGQNFCTGSDQIINVPWPLAGQVRPGTSGFGNQKIAFKVTIPNTFTPPLDITHTGFFYITEKPGANVTARDFTVSANACDFQSGNYLYRDTGHSAPGVDFTVNNPNGYQAAGARFNLQSGTTVYVNVRNSNASGSPTCPFSSCDILFDFGTPNRY